MLLIRLMLLILSMNAFMFGKAQKGKNFPNIVYIMSDDQGQGDVKCYNDESKVPTPNLDKLAQEGAMFTDAHSGSAVCTPTRYGVITGRYCWRSPLKGKVLSGYDPSLIPDDRETIGDMLKKSGYKTALIGKWHLGLDWTLKNENEKLEVKNNLNKIEEKIDFTKPIKLGPNNLGFDYFYGVSASWDFPPYIFIENDHLVEPPSRRVGGWVGDIPPGYTEENIMNHRKEVSLAYWRPGWAASFKPQDALEVITDKSVEYINKQSADQPFFLIVTYTAPHTPVVPRKEFKGKSQCGVYGDFIAEMDNGIGRIEKALKDKGLYDNTILIFTADNGPSLRGLPVNLQKKYNHKPSYIYKGFKGRLDEGGHRVPFIVSWPGHVKPGSVNNSLICLNDLYATFAELTGQDIPDNAAEDSKSFLPALNGKNMENDDKAVVHSDFLGYFGIRKGDWKLTFPKNSDKKALYNLKDDPEEKHNLVSEYPEKVRELTRLLTKIVKEGRSTPGKLQKNDGPEIWEQLYWMK